MGRTKFQVQSSYRYNLAYFYKSRRHQIKIVKRKAHHSLRAHNRFADELDHTAFKRYERRIYYKSYQPQNSLLKWRLEDYRQELNLGAKKDSLKKLLQSFFAKLTHGEISGWSPYRSGKTTDLFADAYKKLKRRGSLSPFAGHRENGVLYKRETVYWL